MGPRLRTPECILNPGQNFPARQSTSKTNLDLRYPLPVSKNHPLPISSPMSEAVVLRVRTSRTPRTDSRTLIGVGPGASRAGFLTLATTAGSELLPCRFSSTTPMPNAIRRSGGLVLCARTLCPTRPTADGSPASAPAPRGGLNFRIRRPTPVYPAADFLERPPCKNPIQCFRRVMLHARTSCAPGSNSWSPLGPGFRLRVTFC